MPAKLAQAHSVRTELARDAEIKKIRRCIAKTQKRRRASFTWSDDKGGLMNYALNSRSLLLLYAILHIHNCFSSGHCEFPQWALWALNNGWSASLHIRALAFRVRTVLSSFGLVSNQNQNRPVFVNRIHRISVQRKIPLPRQYTHKRVSKKMQLYALTMNIQLPLTTTHISNVLQEHYRESIQTQPRYAVNVIDQESNLGETRAESRGTFIIPNADLRTRLI